MGIFVALCYIVSLTNSVWWKRRLCSNYFRCWFNR